MTEFLRATHITNKVCLVSNCHVNINVLPYLASGVIRLFRKREPHLIKSRQELCYHDVSLLSSIRHRTKVEVLKGTKEVQPQQPYLQNVVKVEAKLVAYIGERAESYQRRRGLV